VPFRCSPPERPPSLAVLQRALSATVHTDSSDAMSCKAYFIKMHSTGPRCTRIHRFQAAVNFYQISTIKDRTAELRHRMSWSRAQARVTDRSMLLAFQAGHAGSMAMTLLVTGLPRPPTADGRTQPREPSRSAGAMKSHTSAEMSESIARRLMGRIALIHVSYGWRRYQSSDCRVVTDLV
jgi:hypothetical protein